MLAMSRNGVSLPYGTVLETPPDTAVAVEDPMEAIQAISDGRWIVLPNQLQEEDPEEAQRIDAIGNFLDIASTATYANWGTKQLESGLLVSTERDETEPKTGGVAVVCSTKSSVVQLASVLQCMAIPSTVTESGIILQGSEEDASPPLATALVLPFDLVLWKTASLVYGHEDEIFGTDWE